MITVLFAVLALLAVLWVAGPVLEEKESAGSSEGGARGEHDPARVVLDQIADLDLEHAAGKIPEAAYKAVRADLAAQAAAALAATDASSVTGSVSGTGATAADADEATPARKAAAGTSRAAATGFCPGCGKKAADADKFCAHCGRALRG